MIKYLVLFGILAANANEQINLCNSRIGYCNISERVAGELMTDERYERPFELILSDNYLDNYSMDRLFDLLSAEDGRFVKNLVKLDLSNNRITIEGLSELIPLLLKAEKLEWLDLSSNPIGVDDFEKIFSFIRRQDKAKQIELAKKIVWIPGNYHVERFFSEDSPFFQAHIKYYPHCSLDN